MTTEGVDYSFSRPTPTQLKQAGKTFAVRYFGTQGSGKNTDPTEVAALSAAGIALATNYEGYQAGWMRGGRQAGVDAAKAAHADAVACGMPPTRPIYFSADYNATYDQYKTQIRPCLQGAASVLGASRVGIYGGLEQVDWAHGDGAATWVWQTYAWSYGVWSKHANIQQYHNGVTLGSGTVDLDRAVTADFGQWPAQGGFTMADASDILKAIDDLRAQLTVTGAASVKESIDKLYGHAKGADVAAVAAKTTLDGWARDGVPARLDVTQLSADQLALIGKALATGLVVEGVQARDGRLLITVAAGS